MGRHLRFGEPRFGKSSLVRFNPAQTSLAHASQSLVHRSGITLIPDQLLNWHDQFLVERWVTNPFTFF